MVGRLDLTSFSFFDWLDNSFEDEVECDARELRGIASVMKHKIRLRRASPHDLDMAVEILDQAARWMKGNGYGQWPIPFPVDVVEGDLSRGDLFAIEDEGRVIGVLTLAWTDPAWEGSAEDAGYLHRMALVRSETGRGVGKLALKAVADAVRRKGRKYVRLDCYADNLPLRRFYESEGFEYRGGSTLRRYPSRLYEKRVSDV